MWQKSPTQPNVHSRSENVLSERPYVELVPQAAKTESKCWNLFIIHDICNIQTYTNFHMRERRASYVDLSKQQGIR